MNYTEAKKPNNVKSFDIYVGHVPKIIEQGAIEGVFAKHGEIVDVLYRPGTGSGAYGFAIVKFKYQKDAERVLKNINKIYVSGYEMEVRSGKKNTQSVEIGNGATAMIKTVSFSEFNTSILPVENASYLEPMFYDSKCAAYAHNGNEQSPIMIEIMCINVENAVTFHGCLTNRCNELENISLKLNSICPNLVRLLRTPAVDKVYGALYSVDRAWYRCSVIQSTVSSKRGLCIVKYIDYGNIAEVCYTDMVELPEPLKNLAPFAVKCVFSNLMCSPKSLSGITYLHHLVHKRMSLYAMPSRDLTEYHVIKCSCNGIDVISELLRNGFAVLKSYNSPENSPASNRPDKIVSCKSKTSKIKKASTGKLNNKKDKDTDRQFLEINNNNEKNCNQVISCRNSSSDESQQDFMPKQIIKRGCGVTNAINIPTIEGTKTLNHMLKIDCGISNVKLVNKIRSLFPLHTDDDLINDAVDLLKSEINFTTTANSKKKVKEAVRKYYEMLASIRECNNQALLNDLKELRDKHKTELEAEIKIFFETFDPSVLEKRRRLQEIITALGSNSNAYMDIYLAESPKTVDDLLAEFNEKKEMKKSIIQKARKNTNVKHQKFQNILSDLKKEFSLNIADGGTDENCCDHIGGKRGSWTLKFEESLAEFNVALEEERRTSTMTKDTNLESVIDCILKKLDVPKEKIDAECEIFENYKDLFENLNQTSDMSVIFEELYDLKKSIQTMSSNCVGNGDAKKTSNVLFELHTALLREDALLVNLAKASAQHFPEFIMEHPNLKLADFHKNSYLLKNSWEKKFFPLFANCNRIESCYVSKLADEFVVVKEFQIDNKTEKAFMKRAITWNETNTKLVVKIKGLFKNKDGNILYAVMPPVWETLYDYPVCPTVPADFKHAINLLQKVLEGLQDLHSRGVAHGAVHPLAILHKDEEVLLDFTYDMNYLKDKFCLKGINFKAPFAEDIYSSTDMYGFGCLVLWVLFPNLSFSSTDEGVPNIHAFQSIIQDALSMRDFAALSALLNVNQDLRPTSRRLLSNKFLKDNPFPV